MTITEPGIYEMSASEYETIICADRAAWLNERMSGIGASDAAAVLGVSPWKTALALYADKLGLGETTSDQTEAQRWGHLLEPVIAERYAEETGRAVHDPGPFTIRRSRAHAFMVATLDREIVTPRAGALELKNVGPYRADEWAGEPPLWVQVQVQHQLAVMGWDFGSIAALLGGNRFLWCDVERNDAFIALLVERCEEFWSRVQRLDPPAAKGADLGLLSRLYPRDTGATIALPPAATDWDAHRQEALAQMKHWEAVRDEAEAMLKASIGEASIGTLPGGVEYRWRAITQERKAQEARTVTFRRLDRRER